MINENMETQKEVEVESAPNKTKIKIKDLKQQEALYRKLEDKLANLEKENNQLNAKISEEQQLYQKALNTAAHHENLCKHYRNEYEKFAKYRSQALLEKIIPVFDGFDMAFKMETTNKETENYKIGFQFIEKMLIEAIESEGVKKIAVKELDKFDSNFHQAVEVIETEDDGLIDKICQIRSNGYILKDRLIRPAQVVVYSKKIEKPIENKEEPAKA